jgi:hypothetical protein
LNPAYILPQCRRNPEIAEWVWIPGNRLILWIALEPPLSAEEELKRAKAKIKLLEAEVDFLKKLVALERNKGTT